MLREDGNQGLDEALQLPEIFDHVQEYLHHHDPDLRLRGSLERPGFFVLERRCRRVPAVNTAMHIRSDMHIQARDGYIHVSLVHLEWLHHPWNIITALREEGIDLWAQGGAESIGDELDYEDSWAKETRRRRRQEDGRAYYREQFDILSRIGNGDGTEVTRFNNPGLVGTPPAGTGNDSAVGTAGAR